MSGKSISNYSPTTRYAAIDPATGEDIRSRPISEQYQHHRKQTRIHERSAQHLIERLMSDQLREEYLRAKFPALQSAWEAYRFTLKMVDDEDRKEDRDDPIEPMPEDESCDASDDLNYRMNQFLQKHRLEQAERAVQQIAETAESGS